MSNTETLDDTRPFKVQAGCRYQNQKNQKMIRPAASQIPWWLAEIVYAEYSRRFGSIQSLERINERGGFGREEIIEFLKGSKK